MVLTGDGGGKAPALARSLRGRTRVAQSLRNWSQARARIAGGVSFRPVEINGDAGALALDAHERVAGGLGARDRGRADHGVRSVVNPDKLAHLGTVANLGEFLRPVSRHSARLSAGARSPRLGDVHAAAQAQPAGAELELGGQLARDVQRSAPVLGERALYPQYPRLAVGLQIDTRNKPLIEQEWQHVIPIDALRLRRVDLDPVVEVEEPLGARPEEDQRVKRREQRARLQRARAACLVPEVGGASQPAHLHREQLARRHKLGNPRGEVAGRIRQ